MLPSRNITKQIFVEEFLTTIKAGIITRENFINWVKINDKFNSFSFELEFISNLVSKPDINKLNYLKDSLLALDNPLKLVKLCFELLAHTQKNYVSWEDNVSIKNISKEISSGDEKVTDYLINLLNDLGFSNVLTIENVNDYFKGVLIGLETHRRKNVGGGAYVNHIRPILQKIIDELKTSGLDIELIEEEKIEYDGSSQSKKVDFAIKLKNKIKVGIEVNFYTNTGSKPTEIKRSYGEVNRKLKEIGIELVWITDGFGYTIMKKSLGDAFEIHKNTYNTEMIKQKFKEDLKSILQ